MVANQIRSIAGNCFAPLPLSPRRGILGIAFANSAEILARMPITRRRRNGRTRTRCRLPVGRVDQRCFPTLIVSGFS